MLTTAVWFFVSLAVGIFLRKYPLFLLGLVVCTYALVPLAATGLTLTLKPGDYTFIAFTLASFMWMKDDLYRVIRRHSVLTVLAIVVSIFSLTTQYIGIGGLGSTVAWNLHIVVFPFMAYLVASAALLRNPQAERSLIYVLVLLSAFQLYIGYQQYETGEPIFWKSVFESQWWWGTNFTITQPVGTYGHWIPYAVSLSLLLAVTSRVKSRLVWCALIGATLYVLTTTAARSGFVALALVLVAIIIRELTSRSPAKTLTLIIALPLFTLFAINLFAGEYGTILREKLEDDGYSTTYRLAAADWFWAHWREFILTGLPAGTDLRADGTLNSSLENGFYFYAVTCGMVAAGLLALLFITALLATLTSGGQDRVTGILAGSAFLLSTFTYGAFGAGEYTTLYLFWIIQAIAQTPKAPQDSEPDPGSAQVEPVTSRSKRPSARAR